MVVHIQPGGDMERITLRIPEEVYVKLKQLQKDRPHMSLNALIVEAIIEQVRSGNGPSAA
jgi:predicted HicB family RNase H-like nuclease